MCVCVSGEQLEFVGVGLKATDFGACQTSQDNRVQYEITLLITLPEPTGAPLPN